ncbi:tetratricopeptide TPR_1 repeat-containing protein [Leptolyngbya boryana NIES-2135]|jgi:tetratricopeptide (TPR) repeat protein|uniref:Tetratricopeptide TPR_1 repeat-containing protein n=1 Tax=Leptolyngbya boryana NIES-2135 TaxID=1973484 RepID=A0A1Z4JPX4_LEPBY|nr:MULTISPECIES: tetratricopeptide repeat protein [Leptolyngbya]BAY58717.1 tetratricopeptide TPR_1 repeat-containing protein [Leptolyngbya boryana NIES-2135]MBD2370181.1 tetratricopeptide repeat protein [Leptolyngbya sp. FACHB-161]MBD2376526.1 tetratricopeptide repeat protein [Leptolyngbya sp. FACHB-238]MBD2400799.1 tetratricopeptide repeat protein [Leptolyngbya sp. FACHB-239]MBD2407343.1 tetratricopeptide repeat protein [Leptolyngbya sp. FACHB-402]
MKNGKWLNLAESLTLVGSGVGAIASIASQQLAFTAAPVSFLLLLNVANRRRLDKETLNAANRNIAHLDQRFSDDIKALDQQVRTLPTFVDLASVRKTIQQRHDNAIAQLQHNVSSRLSAIESRDHEQLEKELEYLKTKYSQLAESMATVSQYLNRLVTTNRVESAESEIAELRTEVEQLASKLSEVSTSQKQVIPRLMQDEIHQIHRRLNSLPSPFDATALKQEVDGLVKIVGDLVSRRDMAKLMAEIEKIRHQHQALEQTVVPMRSVNTIMRKQMETLSSWMTTGHPASPGSNINLEQLQNTVAQLEARLEESANLKDMHTEMETMLNGHLSHLQEQFESVQQHTRSLDRQQKQLAEWMGRLPEMLDAKALQNQMKYLTSRLEVTEAQLSDLVNTPKSEYELMFNLSQAQSDPFANTRAVLQEALSSAQSRVIVVFPYPDQATLDAELMQSFQDFLNRGGQLDIGWGHLGDRQAMQQAKLISDREAPSTSKSYIKQILQQLTQLKREYSEQFHFKILGTNENFLVCDSSYGVVGIQPIPTASVAFPEVAFGIRTENQTVIQGLVDRFNKPMLDAKDVTSHLNRAITRYEMGDFQGAIEDYSKVVELDSNHYIAYNNRALIKFELGNYAEAIADLNRAVISHSGNCIAYCNRGVIWAQMGEKNNAIDDFSYAIQVDPACLNAYFQRGLARMKFENTLGAIDDFTAMICIDAMNAVAYFHRGLARSKVSDKTGAIRDLKEAAWLFSVQGDQAKHQHAIAAIHKLRKRFVTVDTPDLKLVCEA